MPLTRTDGASRSEQERDLYLRLLTLGDQTELEPLLSEALQLVMEITGARQAYLEVHDQARGRSWFTSGHCSESELERIRQEVSRGIISQVLSTGSAVNTASARLDPSFRHRDSVQGAQLQAVLCAPIGRDDSLGVIYLHGRAEPGPFPEADRAMVELIGRHIVPFVDRLLIRQRLVDDADATRELRRGKRLDGVIGRSAALAQVLGSILPVAALDRVPVLLTGETGTGKSLFARIIHENGPRAGKPWVEVNCGAISSELWEVEFFGHSPGAFTGAQNRQRPGRFAMADGGTLFLDEVGEIPLDAQSKLLRVLQTGEYERVGEDQTRRADVRIIAATNRDLKRAVEAGEFREDLYYRLEVYPVRIPTLNERREDIPELAQYLARRFCEQNQLPVLLPSPGTIRALGAVDWPANIRGLESTLTRAVVVATAQGAWQLEPQHCFPERAPTRGERPDVRKLTLQEACREFQCKFLLEVLTEESWNKAATARRLDVARSHLYTLIEGLGLAEPEKRRS